MVAFSHSLPDSLRTWALAQPVFFIASAPAHNQHINLSPKGSANANFTVVSPNQCAYVDRMGSGCEAIANGRATLLFCSFDASPRILRLFCRGRVIEWNNPEFELFLAKMKLPKVDAARVIIVLDIFKVQTSCEHGVPEAHKMIAEVTPSSSASSSSSPSATATAAAAVVNERAKNDDDDYHRLEKQDVGVVAGFEEQPTTLQPFHDKREGKAARKHRRRRKNARRDDVGDDLDIAEALAWAEGVAEGFLFAVGIHILLGLFGIRI
ncbi:hypothetical protein Hte_003606 [Hypoxylon texense]